MSFQRTWDTMIGMWNGFTAMLPDLLLAAIIFAIFYIVAKRIRLMVITVTEKRQKARNLGLILGRLAQSGVVVIGVLVVMTIIFPSFHPGDLIQLLGIGSVAIGFAFHDVFQNFLAGILLLLTSSFRIGDQIIVGAYEGTVEDIQTRATTIKTYDGRRVVIPNTDLFTNSVTVNTAFGRRRLDYTITVSFQEDLTRVKHIILNAMNHTAGVLKDPPPEIFVIALAESGITLSLQWWTTMPRHASLLALQDRVLSTIHTHLLEHHVEFPITSQQILLQQPSTSNAFSTEPAKRQTLEKLSHDTPPDHDLIVESEA